MQQRRPQLRSRPPPFHRRRRNLLLLTDRRERTLMRMQRQPTLAQQHWRLQPGSHTLLLLLWSLVYHILFVGLCNPGMSGSTLRSGYRCLTAFVSTEDPTISSGLAMVHPRHSWNTRCLPACSVSGRNPLRHRMSVYRCVPYRSRYSVR